MSVGTGNRTRGTGSQVQVHNGRARQRLGRRDSLLWDGRAVDGARHGHALLHLRQRLRLETRRPDPSALRELLTHLLAQLICIMVRLGRVLKVTHHVAAPAVRRRRRRRRLRGRRPELVLRRRGATSGGGSVVARREDGWRRRPILVGEGLVAGHLVTAVLARSEL